MKTTRGRLVPERVPPRLRERVEVVEVGTLKAAHALVGQLGQCGEQRARCQRTLELRDAKPSARVVRCSGRLGSLVFALEAGDDGPAHAAPGEWREMSTLAGERKRAAERRVCLLAIHATTRSWEPSEGIAGLNS